MYATLDDITTHNRFDDFLLIAENEEADGTLDESAVLTALEYATGEMNVYIAKRYPLPLVFSPKILVRVCLDIALYQLGLGAHGNTEEKRLRYDDAIALLKQVAAGKVELDLTSGAPTEDEDGNPITPPLQMPDAEITHETRLFCRSSMRGVL